MAPWAAGREAGGTTGPMSPSGAVSRSTSDGGVVAGAFAFAGLAVDPGGLGAVGDRGGGEDQVDPHAEVFVEHAGAVVPVGEDAVGGPAVADDVAEAGRLQFGQGFALGRGDVGVADVGGRVEDVGVGRGDVHVAADHDVVGARRDLVAQGRQPFELVLVVIGIGLAAVRHVDRPDADAIAGRRDRARLLLGEARPAGQPRDDVVEADPGEDRDAVPGAFTVRRELVAALASARPRAAPRRPRRRASSPAGRRRRARVRRATAGAAPRAA